MRKTEASPLYNTGYCAFCSLFVHERASRIPTWAVRTHLQPRPTCCSRPVRHAIEWLANFKIRRDFAKSARDKNPMSESGWRRLAPTHITQWGPVNRCQFSWVTGPFLKLYHAVLLDVKGPCLKLWRRTEERGGGRSRFLFCLISGSWHVHVSSIVGLRKKSSEGGIAFWLDLDKTSICSIYTAYWQHNVQTKKKS